MILTGQQKEILKEGILGAYPNEDELSILLSEKMDLSYSAIARGNDYTSRVAYLVKTLQADGRVGELIKVIVEKKPNSPYLKQVKTEFENVNNAKIAPQLSSKETLPVDMSFSDDSQGATIGNYTPNAQGSTIISGGNFSGGTFIGMQINQPSASPPHLRSPNAIAIWREKLAYLQGQEAIAANPATKFELGKQIEECQRKIGELGG
jgi:hypothetical protein